jgi:ribosome maturation factor RimP
MITVQKIRDLVDEKIAGTGIFVIDIIINTGNKIEIFLDHPNHISITQCIEVSRSVESNLDRETDDFELMVSSGGAEAPFKVLAQYHKFEGKKVEVTTLDGEKIEGILEEVGPESFKIAQTVKEKLEGSNKKQEIKKLLPFEYSKVKQTKSIISFN